MSENEGGAGNSFEAKESFEERLRAARNRQGLDPKPGAGDEPGKDDPSPWGIGLRVGVELVSALVVGVVIGWALDHWLGTTPLFLAIFVLLGGAAGILNVWRQFAPRD